MPPRRKAVPVKAGDAISVYWSGDNQWYDGTVQAFNADGTCQLLYADGEREPALDLATEKYKPKAGKVLELIDRVRAWDGDVSKQLREIALVLRDMCKSRGLFVLPHWLDVRSFVSGVRVCRGVGF